MSKVISGILVSNCKMVAGLYESLTIDIRTITTNYMVSYGQVSHVISALNPASVHVYNLPALSGTNGVTLVNLAECNTFKFSSILAVRAL